MKIQELRELLKDYERTWYSRKYVYGEHNEAVQIREFLQALGEKSDDYELTHADLFKLVNIIHVDNGLQLVTLLRNKFNSNYFFEIFNGLNNAGLMDESNFKRIYDFQYHSRYFIYDLFFHPFSERVGLNQKTLEAAISLSNNYHTIELIRRCFLFLERNNLSTDINLKLIVEKSNELSSLLVIFKELEKSGYLNDISLGWLEVVKDVHESIDFNPDNLGWKEIHLDWIFTVKSLNTLADLLVLINQANIPIDEKLIELICSNENIYYLAEISSSLIKSDECLLNNEIFFFLLKEDFKFFLEKNSVLKLLQKYGMLDKKTFTYVCDNDVFSFSQILEILSEKLLLIKNKDLIDKLVNKEFDIYRLYRAISYFKKIDLLDQSSLDSCVKVISIKSNRTICGEDIFDLFELFDKSNFDVSKERLAFLFTWSDANIQRLHTMVSNLIETNLLTPQSFEQAVKRVAEKLPTIPESSMLKNSKKITRLPRSEMILDNKTRFFTEHSNHYESGGFGTVKKGFNSPDLDKPVYGIKKLNESGLIKAKQGAIREVKYHRLLGRQAFYFSKNRVTIVSEWQREKGLHHFNASELLQESFLKRLQCLSSGLSDLNTLHLHYRVHGDVKCQNFILDLKSTTMKLIDFGTSHKRGSSKSFGWTTEYGDPHSFGDHFCKDLYAMGIITMHLFPEIYTVTFDKGKANITVNKSNFTIEEQTIVNLVNAMMHPDRRIRCTSEDALTFCNEIINHFNDLNTSVLEKISNSTINRSNTTVEDVLRDTKRASI